MTHQHSAHAHAEPWQELPQSLAEHLEVESRLSSGLRDTIIEQAAARLPRSPKLIFDLGSGTGADTVALAQRFPEAQVHALDIAPELLDGVRGAAKAAGCDERITTHLVDLNGDWSAEVPHGADLVWASLSIHHLSDPATAARRALESLRPGGTFVMMELTGETTISSSSPTSSSAQLQRILASALPSRHAHPATSWTRLLTEAGFAEISHSEHALAASTDSRDGASYVERWLQSARSFLEHKLDPEDLTAIDDAINEARVGASILTLTMPRDVWIATRPDVHEVEK